MDDPFFVVGSTIEGKKPRARRKTGLFMAVAAVMFALSWPRAAQA
jgi:hypothetical protein